MSDQENQPDLPEALVKALADEERALSLMSARVDRVMQSEIEQHFAENGYVNVADEPAADSGNWFTSIWPKAIAASAIIGIALGLVVRFEAPITATPTAAYADTDGSGQIDIADVFALAKQRPDLAQGDLDRIASRIVSLRGGGL